jgi:chloramphenicol 3-O-phosphotransferase
VFENRHQQHWRDTMHSIVLLAGAPAVGKSTTARALAARSAKSLHLPVDALREMVVSGMAWPGSEWTPALIEQVALARNSAMQMARAYCNAGFDVVIDDFWDPHTQMADYAHLESEPRFKKVMLLPNQAAAEARNRARSSEGGPTEYIAEGIRIVYRDLLQAAKNLPARGWQVIDTSQMSVDEIVGTILASA